MSWRKLKTFAIVMLILMDSIFLFLILQRHYRATHYEDALIDSATEIFRESELYVDRAFLSEKRISLPVYMGTSDPDAMLLSPVIGAIERAGYRISDDPGGISCTNAVGTFYFGDDFGFYYAEKGRYDRPSELLATERYIRLTEDNAYRQSSIRIVSTFLEKYAFLSAETARYGYEVAYTEVYSSGVNYIVTLSQSIQGVPLHEKICVMVSGGRVVSADGIFAMFAPTERGKAETIDIMNILFAEKAHLDAVYREGGSFSYTPMVLTDVSYSYAVYFDTHGEFYFVPLCEVKYASGEARTYNCVSGKLYS